MPRTVNGTGQKPSPINARAVLTFSKTRVTRIAAPVYSEEARTLLCYAADATAARTWVADGATSEEHAAALLKNRLYRRWGIKTAREYARIKIDGLRLVGGNPDFTNAPGHGDDDARFYDRQQAYVHARGG